MAAASETGVRVLTLQEYKRADFPLSEFAEDSMLLLRRIYGKYVDVQPPFVTSSGWQLTSQGWVGYLPLAEDLALSLQPKTPVHNLFRMLEVAYRLTDLWLGEGLFQAQSVDDLYQRLATILAKRTISRCRQGIYRTYVGSQEDLAYVRGRLDIKPLLRQPWRSQLACEYEEHTADVEDNQLLLWTLNCILRSGICTEEHAAPHVRRAFRMLQEHTGLQPFPAKACVKRTYNRLNADYSSLHALCYFFLDHIGPSHQLGMQEMIPFLVDMAALFQEFVAAWLQRRLDGHFHVIRQDPFTYASSYDGQFIADLVVRDVRSRQPLWVMDTKYKRAASSSSADVAQVVAYAVAFGAEEAILIYPSAAGAGADFFVGTVRVRTLAFSLDGDLDVAGEQFVQQLLRGE